MSSSIKIKVLNGKEYQDFKIGADPELRFRGLKARPHISFEGKFGTDGPNSQVGELRPDPFYCPINLAAEIERVMRDGYRRYPIIQSVDWLGGTLPDDQAIGGHIHFGYSAKEDLELKMVSLDALLAPVVLMLEDTSRARSRRLHTPYGKLAMHNGKLDPRNRGFKTAELFSGDSHPLSHSGVEYRPLASWLVSRQITSGILSLAKVIAFQSHNKPLQPHLKKQLRFIKVDKKFTDAHQSCDKRYFAGIIPTIHRIVRTFELYPQYEKYINYLFSLISQGRTWNDEMDIKKRWEIIPVVKQTKRSESKNLWSLSQAWDKSLEDIEVPQILQTYSFLS